MQARLSSALARPLALPGETIGADITKGRLHRIGLRFRRLAVRTRPVIGSLGAGAVAAWSGTARIVAVPGRTCHSGWSSALAIGRSALGARTTASLASAVAAPGCRPITRRRATAFARTRLAG